MKAKIISLSFVVAILLSVSLAAEEWMPIPSGPNVPGQFHWKKAIAQSNREMIEIKWIPPDVGAPCDTTAIIQTMKPYFINEDDSREDLAKFSDLFDDIDFDDYTEDEAKQLKDHLKFNEQGRDPNMTPDGTLVDQGWCHKEHYYNGDDPINQPKWRGTRHTPTSIRDAPILGNIYYTGNRKKYVLEFETCAYCYRDDGWAGTPIGCVKWRYEQTKDEGKGKIIPPDPPSEFRSSEHRAAVRLWEQRHTRLVDGKREKFCPEDELVIEEIKEKHGIYNELEEGPEKEALEAELHELIRIIRVLRGRR